MKIKIQEALDGLKDFQRATVDYAFEQLYEKGRDKFLIADEVGLGKTIVAKGIIAKAFLRYLASHQSQKRKASFNVVYICSNQALAIQNLKKLNFLGNDNLYVDKLVNRLAYLSFQPASKPTEFKIRSLTPGTSFNDRSHFGEINERAIIFALLGRYDTFKNRFIGLQWLLKGTCEKASWDDKSTDLLDRSGQLLRPGLPQEFRKTLIDSIVDGKTLPNTYSELKLNSSLTLWEVVKKVCDKLNDHNQNKFKCKSEIVRILRRTLIKLSLKYLDADIFILDEFQRFNSIIKDDPAENPAIELAREVFNIPDAKVLMLSATPFKPYTNDFDVLNGEVHCKEFRAVLKFLMKDKDESFWHDYEKDKRELFSILRQPSEIELRFSDAKRAKTSLENIYKIAMARTERLIVSKDRNALIKNARNIPIEVGIEDVRDFIALDKVVTCLNKNFKSSLPIPLEYAKSTPFALSFLDNYQLKNKLRDKIGTNPQLLSLLKEAGQAWINLRAVEEYKPLFARGVKKLPNAKLRLLLDESVNNGGWKLLWIPPTLPYYELGGAFRGAENFSKSLVFSSWLMVPRMISSLVSYEAERLAIGDPRSITQQEACEKRRYFPQRGKKRSPLPQFTFKMESNSAEPAQMSSFALIYPCLTLAKLYDPVVNVEEKKSIRQIRSELRKKITALFNEYSLKDFGRGRGKLDKWYWMAPLLLDSAGSYSEKASQWLQKGAPYHDLSVDETEDQYSKREEGKGKSAHFYHAKESINNPSRVGLPKLSIKQFNELIDYLVDYTLASPAVCTLRALYRYYPDIFNANSTHMDASCNIAFAFLAMLNKPESIAVVRIHSSKGTYWERALQYMLDGNLQAVMDEFVYLLKNCENYDEIEKLTTYIIDILGVRTSSIGVDDLELFRLKKKKHIRTHFAVDFGVQKVPTASGANRQVNLRQTFNSPFRPFVLATTSIGQEGLDFHLYCKKIFHWNLPNNPIDFEQREGRINRYKGLVIRQNLAKKYTSKLQPDSQLRDIWDPLFVLAASERSDGKFPCDLIPFWHTEPLDNLNIESFVPLYPFSTDIERYKHMKNVLAFYRLTFGQPRQDELVEALFSGADSLELENRIDELVINLSPIMFESRNVCK
jgi:hypothetical protein